MKIMADQIMWSDVKTISCLQRIATYEDYNTIFIRNNWMLALANSHSLYILIIKTIKTEFVHIAHLNWSIPWSGNGSKMEFLSTHEEKKAGKS